MDVEPYTINIPTSSITRLNEKLDLTTFPDELDEAAWDYGAPLFDIKRLTHHWRHNFSWKTQEATLNNLPNYRARIPVKGFASPSVHFLHQKSNNRDAIPLLFVHGWPGSFLEVTKILPLLTNSSAEVSFHVVAPSLPNFGFSEGIPKKGFGLAQYAEVCHNLMIALGYKRYVAQGGDWGFYITRAISLLYPSACRAAHINMIRANPPSFLSQPLLAAQHASTSYTDSEKAGLERRAWFMNEGSGYRDQQATKPQTLGYSLSDSPVGLLAWIYEKLHDWTDSYPWTDDEILTWVSLYWFSTAGPAASVRIYYEATHQPVQDPAQRLAYVSRDRTMQWIGGVKLGVAHFPKELGVVPRTWARTLGEVAFETTHGKGGHFAAWECPEALVEDLRGIFGRGGPCEGVVKRG
ncbi:MAG: hypothetical protein Q9162_007146 [Coniocarpon cinnabarinum]